MSENRFVIHKPGELIDFETVYEENLLLRTGVPSRPGTVEEMEYTTDVYEDGVTYTKKCYVYLPYGYDPEDREKRYNILYHQHGNSCEPSFYTVGGKEVIDMVFEDGTVDPCIICSITYYMDPLGEAKERRKTGDIKAGDGNWSHNPSFKANYYREVVESIIPVVETRYHSYLNDPTPEGIKASRDHRAFSGYSRGAMMTWDILHYDFEYFRYFNPMSCSVRAGHRYFERPTDEEVLNHVCGPIQAHPELPFFIFACNGGKLDMALMNDQMRLLTATPGFSYGKDPTKNNIFYCTSDYYHADFFVPYYLYNSLKVLFKG